MSVYPTALDSDATLYVAHDNIQTKLNLAMSPTDTVMVVASAAGWAANMIASIDSEQMLVTANPSGNNIAVQRAFAGTAAAAHAPGKLVSNFVDAAYQSSAKSAIIAIETALGTNLSNVGSGPVLFSNTYKFSPIQPGGTLASGGSNQVVDLGTLPAGILPNERAISTITTYSSGTVTGATQASPIVITEAAHGRATNDFVMITGVLGNWAANGYWQITGIDGNSYSLNLSQGSGPYTSGGTAYKPPLVTVSSALPITDRSFVTISYTNNLALNGVWPIAYINSTSFTLIGAATAAPSGGGYVSFDNYHWLYISGGTGTPEAVLIQGGSGTTIRITTVNAHSGAWAITSASEGIREAMQVGKNGCTILLPSGVLNLRAKLCIGDGDVYSQMGLPRSVYPTIDHIMIRGQGFARNAGFPGTYIKYLGVDTRGTSQGAVEFLGQYGSGISNLSLDASPSGPSPAANTAIRFQELLNGRLEDLLIWHNNATSVRGMDMQNCGSIVFENVEVIAGGAHSVALGIGTDGFNLQYGSGGNSQIMFRRMALAGGATDGIPILIEAADNNIFEDVITYAASGTKGIVFFPPSPVGNTSPSRGSFPTENTFYHCPILGGISGPAGSFGLNLFIPYPVSDVEAIPNVPGVGGITTEGQWFGFIPGTFTGATVASATAITPTGQQFLLTGTTPVVNIVPIFDGGGTYPSWEGSIIMIPTAAVPFVTTGNIAVALTATPGVPVFATFVLSTGKWYLK